MLLYIQHSHNLEYYILTLHLTQYFEELGLYMDKPGSKTQEKINCNRIFQHVWARVVYTGLKFHWSSRERNFAEMQGAWS